MDNQVRKNFIVHIIAFISIFFGYASKGEEENIKTKTLDSFFANSVTTDWNIQTKTAFLQTTSMTNTNIDSNQDNETADFDPEEYRYLYGGYYDNGYYYYDDDDYFYDYMYDYYYYGYDDDYIYPELRDFDGQVCQENWGCQNVKTEYCFCDNLCAMYSDCCHDANITSDHGIHNQPFSCQYIPGVYSYWFVFVIETCPEDADFQLNELCNETNERDIYSTTPTSSSSTGFLYKNVHCAMCNRVDDYIFWKADLQCSWSFKEQHNVDNLTI